jgi:hypothetical protein
MRKRDFYMSIAIILLIFFGIFFGPWHRSEALPEGLSLYTNREYKVSLEYPEDWKPVSDAARDRFSGEDGFFEVSAAGSDGSIKLSDIENLEASHVSAPYGTSPTAESVMAGGKPAALILPSDDQLPTLREQAVLIVAYPAPITKDNVKYYYFILWADKEHIRGIADTLKFVDD